MKLSLKGSLFLVGILGIIGLSGMNTLPRSPNVPTASTKLPSSGEIELAEESLPTFSSMRLLIPKLDIDAPVQQVGLTSEGAMDAPQGPNNTGWFKLGVKPGEIGSAVIDGHSGWDEVPAVFDDLDQLVAGDKVSVEDKHGTVISFVVREVQTYAADQSTDAVFTSSDGIAHLNLITCGGLWDEAKQSYSDRIVVFTDRE